MNLDTGMRVARWTASDREAPPTTAPMIPRRDRIAVTLFTGGRGGATIARQLLRTPGIDLSLVINGYDNGLSTGALRRYLPGMLGPSDFRKNLLLHLDGDIPEQAALIALLRYRFPAGATRKDFDDLVGTLASPSWPCGEGAFAGLPQSARAAIVRDLAVLRRRLERHPCGLDLADCALGNLVFAGAYLRLDDFNAAVRSCARTFGSPARLVNVTNGENVYLVALKQDGRILPDEADIVAPQDATAITDLFLLSEPLTPRFRAELDARPAEQKRQILTRLSGRVSLGAEARDAIQRADLIVYGPGTPHSSLLPSYLTPGVADAITASPALGKVFVVNIRADHDVQGLSAPDLVDLTLSYLDDPFNQRRTVTDILCHRGSVPPAELSDRRTWAGARWVVADLEASARPGQHSGQRTVSALTSMVGEATLVRSG
jgi:2-phospho-L-lactate transferase/gluconeogenesis factor (CofD/UPF0052 family)